MTEIDHPLPPTLGRIVWYQTDERGGLRYMLPAIVTTTARTHPGDYPDGRRNPMPVPESPMHVHLTVFSPGGFGTKVELEHVGAVERPSVADFPGAHGLVPGSGTYVEWNVPFDAYGAPRSWRWPDRAGG